MGRGTVADRYDKLLSNISFNIVSINRVFIRWTQCMLLDSVLNELAEHVHIVVVGINQNAACSDCIVVYTVRRKCPLVRAVLVPTHNAKLITWGQSRF